MVLINILPILVSFVFSFDLKEDLKVNIKESILYIKQMKSEHILFTPNCFVLFLI